MGDGTQSKSYVLVTDVVSAVLTALDANLNARQNCFNVATGDYITVREIVALALEVLGVDETTIAVEYGAQPQGWKGDVPVVRLSIERITSLGWRPTAGSRDALRASMEAMLGDLATRAG
jgi:UDP-glucose 4-epimerase